MVERRRHLSFALKSAAGGCVRQRIAEEFDGHRPVELGIQRTVDGPHAALAERTFDAVAPNLRTGRDWAATRIVPDRPLVRVHRLRSLDQSIAAGAPGDSSDRRIRCLL